MPSLYFHTCRKPGNANSYWENCVNWWGYNGLNGGDGYISTQLIGNGRGRLNYGLCGGNGASKPSSKVTVYLNGNEISSISGGIASKDVEFDYTDSDILKIDEVGGIVLQFNSFSVIGCN